MWIFDTETELWEPIKIVGTPPSPRSNYSACSFGNNIFLFGGRGEADLFNDLYIFDSITQYWIKYEDATSIPSPREGCCMVCSVPNLFLLGGTTVNGAVSEVWRYDMRYGVSVLSTNNLDAPQPYANANCFLYTSQGRNYLVVADGIGNALQPLDSVYKYDYERDYWTSFPSNQLNCEGASFLAQDRLVVFGGHKWGLFSSNSWEVVDLKDQTTTKQGNLQLNFYQTAHTYYKSSMYVHGGGNVIGYLMRPKVKAGSMYRLELNEDCTDCSWPCSPGTYHLPSGKCEACPVGTFSSAYGMSACTKCPAGTYNKIAGANSSRHCYACDEDTYASEAGSSNCQMCPHSYTCSIRTVTPVIVKNQAIETSTQPDIYNSNDSLVSSVSSQLQIVLVIAGTILVGIYMVAPERYTAGFRKFDLFKKSHNHFEDEAMYIRKKPLGGLVSLLFLLFAIYYLVVSVVIYLENNIDETKALVPMVALLDKYPIFTTDLQVVVTWTYLVSQCVVDNACNPSFKVSFTGIEGLHITRCTAIDEKCIIYHECTNCQIESGAFLVFESLNISDFTKSINVNLTCSSSIPGKVSSQIQKIDSKYKSVFRGKLPTIVYFEMTPSVRSNLVVPHRLQPMEFQCHWLPRLHCQGLCERHGAFD